MARSPAGACVQALYFYSGIVVMGGMPQVLRADPRIQLTSKRARRRRRNP
jgi:hypothetical protein